MSQALVDLTSRVSTVLAAVLAGTLTMLLPSLLGLSSDTAGSVAIALATLALASLARNGMSHVLVASGATTALRHNRDVPAPVLSGCVTDPIHHPLRPRAPGLG